MPWLLAVLAAAVLVPSPAPGRQPVSQSAPPVSQAELEKAIDRLGALDYGARTAASRTVRRAPMAQAVPVLIQAVTGHADGQAAPPDAQPQVAAAIGLLRVDCPSHLFYLERVLRFAGKTPGFQPLVRGAAAGLAALGAAGNQEAFQLLVDLGATTRDPVRAPVALAVETVALRNPSFTLAALEAVDRDASLALLADAFDMLEEDFEKEGSS